MNNHLILTFCIAALTFGCTESTNGNAAQPWQVDEAAITMDDFQSDPSGVSECIGRLTFKTAQAVQWPTYFDLRSTSHWTSVFSPKVGAGDTIEVGQFDSKFGQVRIAVFQANSAEIIGHIKHELPSHRKKMYEARVDAAKQSLDALRRAPKTDRSTHQIEIEESRLADFSAGLTELAATKTPFEPGRPDAEGYGEIHEERNEDTYSVLRAYITQKDLVYVLESTRRLDEKLTRATHVAEFSNMLKQFRSRAIGEIPSVKGICLPFAFIPDDGTTKVDIKQSIRFQDAPGVLHTIHTGSYEKLLGNGPSIRATALAATGMMGSPEEAELKKFVTHRIGPRSYKIGGLTGIQGGYAARISQGGQPAYEYYSVLTGYRGWEGNNKLPFIVVELSSKLKKNAPELKENPPPFEQSMARHEALLKTVRLRTPD